MTLRRLAVTVEQTGTQLAAERAFQRKRIAQLHKTFPRKPASRAMRHESKLLQKSSDNARSPRRLLAEDSADITNPARWI
jgi:hypothetical protein